MKKEFPLKRISLLLASMFLTYLNAQAQGPYRYWPTYKTTSINKVNQAPWVAIDHIVDDWDWSLPEGVSPAPSSKLVFARNNQLGLSKVDKLPKVNFSCNAVVTYWLNWREMEPTNDTYKWDELTTVLDACKAKGYYAL